MILNAIQGFLAAHTCSRLCIEVINNNEDVSYTGTKYSQSLIALWLTGVANGPILCMDPGCAV